jgi:hypothetical protein
MLIKIVDHNIIMEKVYVVYRYRDYRKENDAEVFAVCKTKANSLKIMKEKIESFADNNSEIEWFEDGANVINGSDCNVFVTQELALSN